MDRGRVLAGAGAVCVFVVVVAVGAFAIVSVAPRSKPVLVVKDALLMESTPGGSRDRTPEPLAPNVDDRVASLPPAPELDDRLNGASDRPIEPGRPADPVIPAQRKPSRVPVIEPPASARLPDVAAPPIRPPTPAPERRIEGVITAGDLRRLRMSLRLTREQLPYWPPVEQVLLQIGTQQAALARAGQDPKGAFGFGSAMQVLSVARPLLDVLREDQKAQIRERARTMGFGAYASSI